MLQRAGVRTSRKRVARLMRHHGLRARAQHVYRRKWKPPPSLPSLLANADPQAINQLWVGDITYLKSAGRWRYLAVVMDRWSRRILGWRLSSRRTSTVTQAVMRSALRLRKPQPGLIFHSDRGVEYGAYAYRDLLARHGIAQSMNRPRGIGDNACMESFFHSLKSDCIHGAHFPSDELLRHTVARYISHYNRHRMHSALGYRSPIDYENQPA